MQTHPELQNLQESSGRLPEDWRVAAAIRIAQEQFRNRGTIIRTIARAVRISPPHLGRLFKKHAGASFHGYLLSLRMEYARGLLKGMRNRSVKEVAFLTGYDDTANFVRDFRRFHGMTPKTFTLTATGDRDQQETAPPAE